jgi:phosphoenolpyruvate carboxykinase (ATP)
MSLEITRKIIDEIHNGNLENATYETSPLFGLHVPKAVNGVNSFLLNPKNTWNNKVELENLSYSIKF